MPSAILGKRTRSASTIEVVVSTPARSTRSKARATSTRSAKHVAILDEGEDGEDSIVVDFTPAKRARRGSTSATKSTSTSTTDSPATAQRIPLSPQKVNTIFRASKTTTELVCPKTPRHRDRAVKPVTTPRHRDREVKPVTTPRHRVQLVGKPLTPRSRMGTATPSAGTPKSIITTAKALFARSMGSGKIVGRDTEKETIQKFLSTHMEQHSGGCLYVSGPPGCGKSALLTEVMSELVSGESQIKQHWVNCMSLPTPSAIYANVLETIAPDAAFTSSADGFSTLESLVTSADDKQLYILVLDEIDHLLTNDLLATLFELSLRPSSRLILVGIANALDLTDRFLPRLKARGLEPDLLPFLPYTALQISKVITSRLRSLLSPTDLESVDASFTPFVHPAAIMLLSRKIEAATGDLRKAFDILRRALELVEMEKFSQLRQQHQKQQEDNKSQKLPTIPASPSRPALTEISNTTLPPAPPTAPSLPAWTSVTAPRATLAHVSRAAASSLGSSLSTRITTLPAHAKAVLCVLVARSPTAPLPIVKLREAYAAACNGSEGKMQKLGPAEMRGVVERLEAAGCVDVMLPGAQSTGKGRKKGGVVAFEEAVKARVAKMELLTAVAAEDAQGRDVFVELLA